MPPSLAPNSPLFGVFAYLDATRSLEQIHEFSTSDIGGDVTTQQFSSPHSGVAKLINTVFRLQFRGCPLRKELDAFSLYRRNDMADALVAAQGLFKRRFDPAEDLAADYCVT